MGESEEAFLCLLHRSCGSLESCGLCSYCQFCSQKTGSTEGHAIAGTSPLQNARVADAPRRLEICRNAILNRDFEAFANIIEHDSDMMHSVMMTPIRR